MGDLRKCADCRSRLAGDIQIVQRASGKHVFVCGRCAVERYGLGQDSGC